MNIGDDIMSNNMIFRKGLVVGIIFLFIGVGIQPVFAIESKTSVVNDESVEDCNCETDPPFPKICEKIDEILIYFSMQQEKLYNLYLENEGTPLGSIYIVMIEIYGWLKIQYNKLYFILDCM